MSKPLALTTTFTPSPSCFSYQYATSKTVNYATSGTPSYGPNLVVNLGPPSDYSTCFPSGWATDSMSYFSPGICPSGYTSACSTLSSLPSPTSGETTVICCPSGYTCGTWSYAWVCTSSFFTPTTLDLFTTSSKSGSYTFPFGGVNAFSVQIRFQATDSVSTTNSSAHATGAVTDSQSPGLSTGAKAGIGVGVAIGVLVLLLLGALLLGALLLKRRRRKPKTDQTPVTEQTPYGIDTKQELDGTTYVTPKVKDVSPPVAELDASEPRSDLTSSQLGTRVRDPTAPGSFAAGGAEPRTQANPTSIEPSPLAVPHAPSQDAVEQPGLVASREVNSSVADPQEPTDAVSAPHEARLRGVEGEHDILQQIKRIREEKERLTRINELERLEAELQERLAGPTTTRN